MTETKEIKVDEVLDIRGEKCPDTFVYTKIKLEEMVERGGGVLKVIVDYPPAVDNMSRSLSEGRIKYKILNIEHKGGNTYEVTIEAPRGVQL